jgi:hypothetical protein
MKRSQVDRLTKVGVAGEDDDDAGEEAAAAWDVLLVMASASMKKLTALWRM